MSDETGRPPAGLVADADQHMAEMELVVTAVRSYFEKLVEAGFKRSEAMTLTVAYQDCILAQPEPPDAPD